MVNATTFPNGSGARAPHGDLEFLALDQTLREEMKRLAQVNEELLGKAPSDPEIAVETEPDIDQAKELRDENVRLRRRVGELERALDDVAGSEDGWAEQKKEFEAILEEKSEVIRALHLKLQETQQGAASGATAKAAENEEIKRLRAEMAEQRAELERDEQALMQQMRQMELAMSRDRAELARQRNELQRMQAELNHEIEMASRDPGLRERLQSLQRRQQETLARKGGAAPAAPSREQAPQPTNGAGDKKSGFFGRLFGK
ncbi:MAG: hypothetical protein U0793_29470 [Gemmataceae bacterium]